MNITKNRHALTLLALIISILLVVGLKLTAPEKRSEMKALPKARVQVTEVRQDDLQVQEVMMGRLQPLRTASLRFEVSGLISERHVEAGQQVQAGDKLLSLEQGDYINAETDARSQYEVEQSAVARDRKLLVLASESRGLQEKEVKRLQRLVTKSLTSRSQLEAAEQKLASLKLEEARLQYSVQSADARLAVRKSAWERAQRNLQRTELKSPWSGLVNNVHVQSGDYVSPSQVVVEIIDKSRLEFILPLRGKIAHLLKLGDPVDLQVGNQQVSGTIIALQSSPDPSTFTYDMRVRLPADVGYPGLVVEAYINLPPMEQVTIVPVTALLHEGGMQYVMVYQNGTLQKRQVEMGTRSGQLQVIEQGVRPGEMIVSRDVASLSDGQSVEMIN